MQFQRERQQSQRYKTRQKKLAVKKKEATKIGTKNAKKSGHDYNIEKDVYRPNKKVRLSDVVYEEKTQAFHKFKVDNKHVWYRGYVEKRYELKGKLVHDVLFDDGQMGEKMTARVLRKSVPDGELQYFGNKNLLK